VRVTVRLSGMLRTGLGEKQLELVLPPDAVASDVATRLLALADKRNVQLDSMAGYMVFLRRDGVSRSLRRMAGPETQLQENDELTFLYRFTGG